MFLRPSHHTACSTTPMQGKTTDSRHFSAAASCRAVLRESGFDAPEWETLLTSLPRALAAFIPGALAVPEQGWQHVASLVVEERFVNTVVVSRASPAHRAMLRSQGGPLSGLPFTTLPNRRSSGSTLTCSECCCCVVFTFLSTVFPRLPVGRPLDCLGHHRASCSRAGVLGRRGFALESAVARGLPRGRRQSLSKCVLARPRPSHRCHGPTPDRGDR